MTTTSCLEGGHRHSWVSHGLDIIADALRYTRRCVWCNTRQDAPPTSAGPGRSAPGRWRNTR